MISKPKIGVSECLAGSVAHFTFGGKPLADGIGNLFQWVSYSPVLTDFFMNLPTAVMTNTTAFDSCASQMSDIKTINNAHYPALNYAQSINSFTGFIICNNSHNQKKTNTGIAKGREKICDEIKKISRFRSIMQEKYPWIPVVESEQLVDPILCENFIIRVFTLSELNSLRKRKLTRKALIAFHSRYKLLLLAHSQPGYRELGPFVAQIHQWDNLDAFFTAYRKKLMAILKRPATRANHTNVMMHVQGYFRSQLSSHQRSELSGVIHDYRSGLLPISAPLGLFKRYLSEYPDNYLLSQRYFMPYSDSLYRLNNSRCRQAAME